MMDALQVLLITAEKTRRSWCVMDGKMQNERFRDLVFMKGLSEQWEGSVNPSPRLLGYDLSFTVIHTSLKKKVKTPASRYILNPQPCQIPLKYDSILFHYPFDSSFHASLRLTWYTYNYHSFFPPSSFKLPLIHSSMTLTSAPGSPFCLNRFPAVSFYSPLFPGVSDDPCMHSKSQIETRVTKKNTLQPWLFIIITRSNGTWSVRRNGPLTLQIEKEGNENRRARESEQGLGSRDHSVVT